MSRSSGRNARRLLKDSSEKRLARVLLLLAHFGKAGKPEPNSKAHVEVSGGYAVAVEDKKSPALGVPGHGGSCLNPLQKPGKRIFGSGDADIDIGSNGTLHATTAILLFNPPFTAAQVGVSAIMCPGATSGGFSISRCHEQIIDSAQADRSWITSAGPHVYISYPARYC